MFNCEFKVNFCGNDGVLGFRSYIEDMEFKGIGNIVREVEKEKDVNAFYKDKEFLNFLKEEFKKELGCKLIDIKEVNKIKEGLKVKLEVQFFLDNYVNFEKEVILSKAQLKEAYKEIEFKSVKGFFGAKKEDKKYIDGGLNYLIENMDKDSYCNKKLRAVISIAVGRHSLAEELKNSIKVTGIDNIRFDLSYLESYEK